MYILYGSYRPISTTYSRQQAKKMHNFFLFTFSIPRIMILLTQFTNLFLTDKSLARPGKKQATATEDFDVHISYLYS